MTAQGWLQIAFYVGFLTLAAIPLGRYMARVYEGENVLLSRILGPLERLIYRSLGKSARVEQDWKAYAKTVIVFSLLFWLALYLLLRIQGSLPLNPEGFGAAPWDVTFNTTTSFVTNTNWQFYGGETTMSYLSQMAGLAVQNFVSAAIGMAVLIAAIRGFRGRATHALGNFWQDLTRTLLYILLPLSFLGALILVSQGVIQTFERLGRPRDPDRHGGRPDAGARADGFAGGDQAAGHQRRRLLQRQLGVPVREPDRVLGLRPDVLHPLDPGWARVHLRAHGPQPPAGLGPVRGDGGADGRRARRHLRGRAARLTGAEGGGSRARRPARAPPAATSRARSSATGSSPAPSGPASPPTPRTAR